ncbi:MAG: PorV/PorQ family protein [Candidatus Cloacimonetes bacterium]|nr:PorV/PorQ family protein [Candidatus Cloacimonadota bacterium]
MKKIMIVCAITLVLLPSLLMAEPFGKVGTAALQFLKLGIDARAVGMGEAYTAVTDDISSVFWNPAGLAPSKRSQAFFSHTNWPASIMHEFAAASYATGVTTFAVYTSILHMDQMEVTEEDPFGPTGETFTASNIAAGLAYAQQYTDKFSAGASAKYLRENLGEFSIDSFAFDLGSMYNTGWRNVKIGMALRNFGPDVKYRIDNDGDGSNDEDPYDLLDNDGDGVIDEDGLELPSKIPMSFSLGISGDLYRTPDSYLIASLQLDNVIDRLETWNLGAEYKLNNLFLRSGYQFNYDTNGFSAGVGWQIATRVAIFNIDYAYTDMGYLAETFLKSAHRVSIKMSY